MWFWARLIAKEGNTKGFCAWQISWTLPIPGLVSDDWKNLQPFFCLPTFPRNSNFLKPPTETSHCTLGGAFAHADLKAKEKISCSHNCLLRSVNNAFVSRETIARHLKASETHFESKTSVDSLLNDSHSKSHWCEPRWWSYLDNLK